MLLLFAFCIASAMAVAVFLFGEERRVRYWLATLCAGAAILALGLWVEIYFPAQALLAAKSNMTVALVLALSGMRTADIMCDARVHKAAYWILGIAAIANILTVWVTDLYFTGEYIQYPWGGYVAGRIEFLFNPALVFAIGIFLLVALARRYRDVHPLDRNRVKYIFLSYSILTFALADYLPHFGINLFNGPVSGVAIPLFVMAFGYANSRYRLLGFGDLVVRISGWLLTAIILVSTYWVVYEVSGRLPGRSAESPHIVAAIATLLAFALMGNFLPNRFAAYARRAEEQLQRLLARFSSGIQKALQESDLQLQLDEVCVAGFGTASATFIDLPETTAAETSNGVMELEVLRRLGKQFDPQLAGYEIAVPLYAEDAVFGVIALGARQDGQMYSARLLQIFRTMGDVFGLGITNLRRSLELHQRLQLDRFLAPQFVESMLAGNSEVLDERKRTNITTFFSDLVGFTAMSDRLDPEQLSTVLNEYLSAMSDIAFAHGGTIDKFIGDAVMVIFGAPIAQEEALQVESALRMSRAMYQAIDELNDRWRAQGYLETDLNCRIGIHCGEATVGSFGSDARADYTAIGHAVNLASRLEGQCTPGHILLSEETWRLVEPSGQWQAVDRGALSVKGISRPVRAFEIAGQA